MQGSTRRSATRLRRGREGAVPPPRSKAGAGGRGRGHPPRGAATAAGWAAVLRAGHQRADSVVMRSLQNTQLIDPFPRGAGRVWARVARGSKVTPPGSSTADAPDLPDPEEPRCRLGGQRSSPTWGCRWRLLLTKCVRVAHPEPWHECSGQAHTRPGQEPVTTSFPGQRVTRAAGWEVGGASDRRDGLGWKPWLGAVGTLPDLRR